MKRFYFSIVLILLLFISVQNLLSQDFVEDNVFAELEVKQSEKLSLINSIEILDNKANKLGNDVKKAYAKTVIADALWKLDSNLAKRIIKKAYYLSLPNKEERKKLKSRTKETAPSEPTDSEIARLKIRSKILQIVKDDKNFVKELTAISSKEMGEIEKAETYNNLAYNALKDGNINQAKDFINRAMQINPTQQVGLVILQVAAENRELADELIIQYMQTLDNASLSPESFFRAYFGLKIAVFPNPLFDFEQRRQIPISNPRVIRHFTAFSLGKMVAFERNRPGSMRQYRGELGSLWLPINRYVPELINSWQSLEQTTRGDNNAPLDQSLKSQPDKYQDNYEKSIEEALESKEIKALSKAIRHAVYRKDYKTARKILKEIEDENTNKKINDYINSSESIWLAKQGKKFEAQELARKLNYSKYILRTFPIIIEKCVELKDQVCAFNFSNEAIKLLKKNENEEIPIHFFSSLAKSVYKLDNNMAFDILEEMIKVFNVRSKNEGIKLGFDSGIFKQLAKKDEGQTLFLAESFNDPFTKIVSLSEIYKWKGKKLEKEIKKLSQGKLNETQKSKQLE